ncbi:mitochondria-eating protein isoform X6 [Pseudophryne corroboree]|uniref:mitochondria-eating protein isoform X6 n=1 Tax=Pseudophryne corroboree TaxID=495146 RepID=UPI0030816272
MADTLRRLTNSEKGKLLQDKLEDWYKDYHINSCDHNLNICCELLELNSRIQGQLFTILNVTAREGGQYAGVETLKSRFLPWLGTCFSNASPGLYADNSFSHLQVQSQQVDSEESLERDKRLRELSSSQEKELQKLETQLASARVELNSVRQDLRMAHDKAELRNLDSVEDYERQIRLLKDEISILSAEKSILHGRLSRSRSPSPIRHSSRSASRSASPFTRSESPTGAQLTNASRHSRLISRFNDIYANDRLDAQNLLRRYIEDLEMVQRIIFIATVESFHAAKLAFRQFKLRVRKSLSPSHMGPESLEDAVIDYIVRNLDLYDVQSSVNEVISAMNVNPKISFPAEIDFILISSFIREVCRVAFAMQTLETPLDIAFGIDGELFSETKYRRTYDSELTAPLVFYHVWPTLMENDLVVFKGEAVTKRGALWSSRRSRSRSCSPVRSKSASPGRTLTSRGRSPSPRRSGTPSKSDNNQELHLSMLSS